VLSYELHTFHIDQ